MILDSGEGGFGDDGGKCTGFISHHEEEWRLVGYGVRAMIVGEFCEGNGMSPRSRIRTAKDPKIGFHFLVHTFRLPIGLRVVGSGEGEFIS